MQWPKPAACHIKHGAPSRHPTTCTDADLLSYTLQVDGKQHAWLTVLKRSQKNTSAKQSQTIVSSFLLLTQQAAALSDHNLLMKQQVQRRCSTYNSVSSMRVLLH